MDKKEIVLFTDGNVVLEVLITPEQDTIWQNRNQMAELFERDVKKYINNALKEELQDQSATVANFATVQIEGNGSMHEGKRDGRISGEYAEKVVRG